MKIHDELDEGKTIIRLSYLLTIDRYCAQCLGNYIPCYFLKTHEAGKTINENAIHS